MKFSEAGKKELKRVLEELYCENCESEDCGLCQAKRFNIIEDAAENVEACLEM